MVTRYIKYTGDKAMRCPYCKTETNKNICPNCKAIIPIAKVASDNDFAVVGRKTKKERK